MDEGFNRARNALLRTLVLVWGAFASAAHAETFLGMAEEVGCMWCAQWNAEVAPEYPKTSEGRAAPLRRFDKKATPADIALARPVRFTPTFVLVRDGREVARIEGYPGEDFFWGLLQRMLTEAGIDYDATG